MLYMCIEYHIQVNMYHVSAQGVDECTINVIIIIKWEDDCCTCGFRDSPQPRHPSSYTDATCPVVHTLMMMMMMMAF